MSDDVPGIENDPTPKSAALAEELRRVAGTRSPKALRDAHLPTLQRYLAYPDDPDRKLDALRNELEASVGAIADPQFRAAAKELFGFGEHRWTPLRARGERASASFGCSFDAYRRARRSTGTSLLDETVEQLADAIRQRDRTLEGVGRPATEPGPTNGHPMPAVAVPVDRHRRVAILSGVLALVAIVALLSVALTHRPDPPTNDAATGPVTSPTPTAKVRTTTAKCRYPIGTTDDPSLSAFRKAFATQIVQLTPPGDIRPCGAAPVSTWQALTIQPLSIDGKASGALVAIDPDHLLLMTEAEFTSYHQIGGKNGNQAQSVAGLPRRRRTTKSGRAWLIVTDHGALVSEGIDQPGFYVGGPAWTRWEASGEDSGEMGIPTSNPLNNAVGYYQDYAKGRLTLSYSGTLGFRPVPDPAAGLPSKYRGQILRHDDGTTWYVDLSGARHWIPDGETWVCMHDRGARELGGVPGYATATLPLGPPASCKMPR